MDKISNYIDLMELSIEKVILNKLEQGSFVSLNKENLVQDVKLFLYNYCTQGDFRNLSDGEKINRMRVLKIIQMFKL